MQYVLLNHSATNTHTHTHTHALSQRLCSPGCLLNTEGRGGTSLKPQIPPTDFFEPKLLNKHFLCSHTNSLCQW